MSKFSIMEKYEIVTQFKSGSGTAVAQLGKDFEIILFTLF